MSESEVLTADSYSMVRLHLVTFPFQFQTLLSYVWPLLFDHGNHLDTTQLYAA